MKTTIMLAIGILSACATPHQTAPSAQLGPFYCCPPSALICRPGQHDYAGDLLPTQFVINSHCGQFPAHCHCP
jgi:hypothetical protein